MLKILRNNKGVTLIEAVFTVAIIGAGLLGVLYAYLGGAKSSLLANQTVVAANLAKEKLEEIVADRASQGYAATILTNYSDGQLAGDYSAYTRNVTILEVNPDDDNTTDDFLDPSPGSGYARLTVVVTWSGGTEQVKLESLIADYTMP
ncbi:MAG: prepilin-type N-terminal cleavage/methylation domain-containing protein [Pseudomonadota bacterium]